MGVKNRKCTDEEIVDHIVNFIETYQYPPSFEDVMISCGYTSKSSIFNRLSRLRDKGLIDYVDNIARTITVKGYKYVRCE